MDDETLPEVGTLHVHRLSVNIFHYLLHVLGMQTLPSLHIYVGSDHFWGFKIFNFNIVWVFRKMNIFWGMKKLWILQNWIIWCVCAWGRGGGGEGISIHFKDFLKVKVQNWIFFLGVAIIFWGGGGYA